MSTTISRLRFPIRLDPIAGESFDGWIDAYAQRLTMPGRELGHALGLPDELLRLHGSNVAKGDPVLDADQIAARACGIDPVAVSEMWFGLARYDRLIAERVSHADTRRRAVRWFARVLRPMVASRWCPGCLGENGGRWLASWRLPWYLACPTHQTMLASGCPACGGTQRYGGLRAKHVPELLTTCSRPTTGRAGHLDNRCRQDLTIAAAVAPPPDDLIALQAEMIPILDPVVTDDDALKLIDRLVDLLITATRIGLDLRAIDRDRRNMPSILTTPLADAHSALSDPHGTRMRAIATNDPARHPGALPQVWDGVSDRLAAIVLQHRDKRLGPTDRLRYRSITPTARRPEGIDPSTRLRALPLAIWPDWSIRLRPPTIAPDTFRIAAAIALCVPGSTAPLRTIRDRWPGARSRQRMVMFGRRITADPHGTAILATLCALADTLDRDGAPIDYERRRTLATENELLDCNAWTIICRAGGTPSGHGRKLAHARLWLWETLTGGLPQQAPPALRPKHPEFLISHTRFALRLEGPTARRLTEHARRLLNAHGCHDEPLTWSPARDAVALDQLPGPDPDTLDPNLVHAVLARVHAPSQAAEELAITLEHLRYLVRQHPPASGLPDPNAPPRARLAALLTPEELRELVDHGSSLRAIAARYDINRKTIRDELIAHGTPIPPKRRHHQTIERDWLHEQYVAKRRTTLELARELGAAPSTISRLLHRHRVPVRPAGIVSHQQNLTAGDGFPEPLASAVHGRGGADRVRRFQVYARTRSLTAGAKRLAVQHHALTVQLDKLEQACEAKLLERITHEQRPQRPTALGQTLLSQADQYLGPHPNTPQQLPEPLATILGAHFGEKKLATFLAAMTSPTITVAATELGVQPGSLQRAIRNVEHLLGQRVITDRGRSAPLHLTPTGARLLKQAQEHQP